MGFSGVSQTLHIPHEGALDLLSLGGLVHRLDPGAVPFRKAHECQIYVSGGEFNVAANLLQAQRDFFGAHTYERLDKPRGQFFHTNWTGRGGKTSSGTYNA